MFRRRKQVEPLPEPWRLPFELGDLASLGEWVLRVDESGVHFSPNPRGGRTVRVLLRDQQQRRRLDALVREACS